MVLSFRVTEARAQSLAEELTGAAKADYDAARILYTDGDYAGAALKFQQAYAQSKDPRLLWNVAAARKGERQYAEVERLVKRYLAETRNLSADDQSKAETLLQTIDAFIADLAVTVDQPGASVFVDGVEAGTTPLAGPLRVDIGDRMVVVRKPGYVAHEEALKVTGDTNLAITLAPDVHEGRLRIVSSADATVLVDGKPVTSGAWEGLLPSGPHSIEVTAPGRVPYKTETVVQDGQNTTLRVELESERVSAPPHAERSSSSTWLWVAAGALVLGGAAAGGYFLLNQKDPQPAEGPQGTLGTLELRLGF